MKTLHSKYTNNYQTTAFSLLPSTLKEEKEEQIPGAAQDETCSMVFEHGIVVKLNYYNVNDWTQTINESSSTI